ncbi:MAG: hypothetical protein H6759_03615 [Candidatus Nomurabacteria bacterium]|nr:MAG: hypothetical protein H6759_03615 [Candidatus Nomurabacteria bacterium]
MPLKRIYIDWGDGQSTKLADTKLKNHKPYCNVQSECSDQVRASGLTCNSDGDCPAGAGLCKSTGVCQNQPQKPVQPMQNVGVLIIQMTNVSCVPCLAIAETPVTQTTLTSSMSMSVMRA